MRSVIPRKDLLLEVGASGIVLVLAYFVLSETTLAVQNDRPAIKIKVVVAETLTLSNPKRAGTASLVLSSGPELSLLQFASPDGVDNLKVGLVRGYPNVLLWDAKKKVSLFMEATQDGNRLRLIHNDDPKRMLGIFYERGTPRIMMKERGGGVAFLVEDRLPAPLAFSTSPRRHGLR